EGLVPLAGVARIQVGDDPIARGFAFLFESRVEARIECFLEFVEPADRCAAVGGEYPRAIVNRRRLGEHIAGEGREWDKMSVGRLAVLALIPRGRNGPLTAVG